MKNLPGFTAEPAEYFDIVDPQWVWDANPLWTIQDCSAYHGGYAVNEQSADDDPGGVWMRDHGVYATPELAAERLKELVAPEAQNGLPTP